VKADEPGQESQWSNLIRISMPGRDRFFLMRDFGLSRRWRFKSKCSEDGGSIVLRNVRILPQLYTVSLWRWRQHCSPKNWYPIAILHSVTLKMEAAYSSETMVSYNNSRQLHSEDERNVDLWNTGILPHRCTAWQPRYRDLNLHCHGNLKSLHPENGGSMTLRNVAILQHYTVSRPRRLGL